MDFKVLFFIVAVVVNYTYQSTDDGIPPSLILDAIDVEVDESEDRRVDLYGGNPLVACTDDDPARAYIQTVSPSSPCGRKCFSLEPCGTGNNSEYCLFFLASQGKLKYSSAAMYTLTIGCTDDVETPTVTTMTVTVEPNTPPTFNPPSPLTIAETIDGTGTAAGDTVYDVNADDIDGDPIYYTMSTNPSTPYLKIGYTDGVIRATNDLKFMCKSSISASVSASDNINPSIGPLKIDFTVDPHNEPPVVNNLDTTVTIDENVGADATVLILDVVDPNTNNGLNFHMRSTSDSGMEQYYLETTATGATLKTRIDPNYERSDTRSVQLYFDVDDGYCKSKTYSLTVKINDINEPPELTPEYRQILRVYEGDINVPTQIDLIDEDINDKHTFTKTAGSNMFGIDATSGDIYSLSEIDIDPNVESQNFFIDYRVTDQGGLTDDARVLLQVLDRNDNPPYFQQNSYNFGATACTDPGTRIGTVFGDDDDSEFNQNDEIVFGGGAGKLAVMSNGAVVLTQPCLDGEVSVGAATITDQGIYPGPLKGKSATITLTCGPCPPPQPPVTNAPAPATTAAPATTTAGTGGPPTVDNDSGGINDFLAWLIPAILGGLLWLALTAYFCYRYCFPCRNPCAGRCKRRPKKIKPAPKKEPKPQKPKKVKPLKPNPPPPPPPPPPKPATPPPPPPPPPPEPKPDPYHFGFWKETYTDQDANKQPVRVGKPEAIENMPAHNVIPRGNVPPPENLKLGNPIGHGAYKPPDAATYIPPPNGPSNAGPAGPANAAAPNKKCVIQ